MGELGNILSRARRARGITIEDAERDTHVSKRYLQALEAEDFTIFPAPVYARGFLRTYSRYLGLNPEELLRIFPNGELNLDITPLPTVTRPPAQMINVNWIVAGLVTIFLLGAGLLLLRSGDNSASPSTPLRSSTAVTAPLNSSGAGQVQSPQQTDTAPQIQGRAIVPARPGQLPDFVGADVASSLAVLRDNQIDYALIGIVSRTTPKNIVISQSPSPGSKIEDGDVVTLQVSNGP
jgi:hypothetical protein